MSFALNLLWFICGGVFLGLFWSLAGILCFVSIIGIPFGFACFRIAGFAFLPFGKDLIPTEMMGGKRILGTGLMNFIWCVFFGWWLAILAAVAGVWYLLPLSASPVASLALHSARPHLRLLAKQPSVATWQRSLVNAGTRKSLRKHLPRNNRSTLVASGKVQNELL